MTGRLCSGFRLYVCKLKIMSSPYFATTNWETLSKSLTSLVSVCLIWKMGMTHFTGWP